MNFVHLRKDEKEKNLAWIEWDHPQSKANVLSEKALGEFSQIADQIIKEGIPVACLISKKPSVFIAGADLTEIQQLKTAEDFSNKIQKAHQLFKKLENSSCTFISAIHGACLGGGTELVLACDYRIATFKAQIGLPEVNLGLIPGFGGCVRLKKWVGFSKALNMIITGQALLGKQAYKTHLVDAVVPVSQLEASVRSFASSILKGEKKKKRSQNSPNTFMDKLLVFSGLRRVFIFFVKKQVLKKTKGFYEAPIKALALLHKIHSWPLDKALKEEEKVFCQLAVTSTSKNLIQLFFLTESIKKQTGWPQNQEKEIVPIQKVGVLGAGVMGGGIAYMSAYKGFLVRLCDLQADSLVQAKKQIIALFSKQVKRRKLNTFTKTTRESQIVYSQDVTGFSSADIVIEAIVEDLSIKKKVLRDLSSAVGDNTVLATNTSSLSVSEMAQACTRPSHFIGMHFFNPVHRMPLVEIIKGTQTSDETVARVFQFAKTLGKYPIIVQDSPGFLVNRLLLPWLTEALWLLGEGQGVRFIDRIFTKEWGWPMGPFRLMDEVGLDVCLKVIQSFQSAGLKLSVPDFVYELAQEGALGKKTLLGFYHYTDKGQARSVNTALEGKFRSTLKSYHQLDKDICLNRGIYRMINEASKVLEEKVTSSSAEIDLAMIMGAGFPPFRGGLLRYADDIGMKNILDELDQWVAVGMDRFQPSNFLRSLVPHGSFYKNQGLSKS